jgi:hypothetical protein
MKSKFAAAKKLGRDKAKEILLPKSEKKVKK